MWEIELSGSVGPGWPTPNSWERRRRFILIIISKSVTQIVFIGHNTNFGIISTYNLS